MKSLEYYCERALEWGLDGAKRVDPRSVVTAECHLDGPCKQRDLARPSMEACGIDVFRTARDNGVHIEVVKTLNDERKVDGLILVE
ncbi:MAG: DUF2284 domain-containing protein [Thermodesulfobacteriota bacterium]